MDMSKRLDVLEARMDALEREMALCKKSKVDRVDRAEARVETLEKATSLWIKEEKRKSAQAKKYRLPLWKTARGMPVKRVRLIPEPEWPRASRTSFS